MTRLYQKIPLAIHQTIELDAKASHHVMTVLRASVGDSLVLFNGEGGEYHAVIREINKKKVVVQIKTFVPREAKSSLDLHLAQGIARGEKMDFIIQKAVELGVNHITPLITERCNVRLQEDRSEKRYLHWQSVIISACEQTGRNDIPHLSRPVRFDDWILTIQADEIFILSPHVEQTLADYPIAEKASILLVIGPEGGLSPSEIEAVMHHGGKPLHLGPRILRTETAALAMIAALQARNGDFC